MDTREEGERVEFRNESIFIYSDIGIGSGMHTAQ